MSPAHATRIAVRPNDGQSFYGLLVGGNADVARTIATDLFDEFGITIRDQWFSVSDTSKPLPRGCEVVLILTDFCAHEMSRRAVKSVKAAGIRYALIGRKKSAWLNGLNLSGFVHKPSWLKVPAPPPSGPRKEIVMTPVKEPPKPNGVATVRPPDFPPPPAAELLPRYVPRPRPWTDSDAQTLARLAEASNGDGAKFIRDVWQETGVYRTPAVLRLRVDAFRVVIKVPMGLIHSLEKAARATLKAKTAYLKDERAQLKRARTEWPLWISADAALELVGGVHNRIKGMAIMTDRLTGCIVYGRDQLIACLEEREARGLTASPEPVVGYTDLEWEKKILRTLEERGPTASAGLGLHSKFGRVVMERLIQAGRVLVGEYYSYRYYRLPGQAWPPPPRKLPPRMVARQMRPKEAPIVVNIAPGSFGNPVDVAVANAVNTAAVPWTGARDTARADIYRMMREGKISAAMAVEMINALREGT